MRLFLRQVHFFTLRLRRLCFSFIFHRNIFHLCAWCWCNPFLVIYFLSSPICVLFFKLNSYICICICIVRQWIENEKEWKDEQIFLSQKSPLNVWIPQKSCVINQWCALTTGKLRFYFSWNNDQFDVWVVLFELNLRIIIDSIHKIAIW